MTTKPTSGSTLDLTQMIALANQAAHKTKAERMALHRANVQSVMFKFGLEGVNRYKDSFPDAKSIRLFGGAIASIRKPEGYDAYLVADSGIIPATIPI
jgi:hypothetical protein